MLPLEKKKRCLLVSFKKEVLRRYAEESGVASVKAGGARADQGGGVGGVRGQVDWGCQAGVKGSGLVKGSAAQLSPSLRLCVTGTTCSHTPSGWTGAFRGTLGSENVPGGCLSPLCPQRTLHGHLPCPALAQAAAPLCFPQASLPGDT